MNCALREPEGLPDVQSTVLVDEINLARFLLKSALMAVQALDPDESNALSAVLGLAEGKLDHVLMMLHTASPGFTRFERASVGR